MPITYSLSIQNHSTRTTDFCLFFKNPAQAYDLNLYSVAWASVKVHPHATVQFKWDFNYDLTYYETGFLEPGICLQPSSDKAYHLQEGNSAVLTNHSGALSFDKSENDTPNGFYAVYTDDTIPPHTISLGINISNKTAFVYQATPNYKFSFVPKIEYWIASGSFTAGEVLNFNQIIDAYKIEYPDNCFSKTLNFEPKCPWSESN